MPLLESNDQLQVGADIPVLYITDFSKFMPSIGVPSGCGILVYMGYVGEGVMNIYGACEQDGDYNRFYVYDRQGQYLGLSEPLTDAGASEYFVWEASELLNACLKDVKDEVILEFNYPNVKPVVRFDCAISSLSDMIGRKLYLSRYPLLSSLWAALPLNKGQGCIFDGVYVELKKTSSNRLVIANLTCNQSGSKALVPYDPERGEDDFYYQFTGEACNEDLTLESICDEFDLPDVEVVGAVGEAEISFPVFGLYI